MHSDAADDVIAVDQVGYRPGGAKVAIVPASAEAFSVVDETGDVVHEGAPSAPIEDPHAGERVRHADFSAVREPGEYRVVAGDARSPPFEIDENVYDEVLRDVGRLYALKRSGTGVDDPVTGLEYEAGHTQDAEAELYFSDPFHDEGEELDVSGGWYDAGDYGKYTPPAAITVGQQLLAYELYPDAFDEGQFELPPEVDAEREPGLPDLLAEVKFELEWLVRMQRPDGAVYLKVAGEEWADFEDRPVEDDQPRCVFGLSTFGTAQYAGAMAQAARVYEGHDDAFAERALENAEAAAEYLADHPDAHFRFDEGQDGGSGPYRKESDEEERLWALAELLRTTGEDRFADRLHDRFGDRIGADVTAPVWTDARTLGNWAYYNAEAADPDRRERVADAFREYAGGMAEKIESDGYRDALHADDYHWASSKKAVARGLVLLLADRIDPDPAYREAALDQLHYVLGRSPTGYSYVTGHGSRPVQHPHDRIVASTGTSIPGMLVSGANANGDDEVLGAFLEEHSPPPAKAFVDEFQAYSATEWAIDYTAPLFAVLGYATGEL